MNGNEAELVIVGVFNNPQSIANNYQCIHIEASN